MADQECIFCAMVAGKIQPAAKVYEDGEYLAFLDINPRNPGHTIVITKKHYEVVLDMPEKEAGKLFELVKRLSVSVKNGTQADGISILQNNYRASGQAVPHIHFHVIPRFNSEGPPALETILSVKRMPEDVLKKIAESIKSGGGSEPKHEKPKETKKKDLFEDF
ncbi:MAG: HIT family protein [Candidatus Aenigmarchaeota archaeon]|nr:HIT family protein [Candidatus Aenigmarchaeota archaeon]